MAVLGARRAAGNRPPKCEEALAGSLHSRFRNGRPLRCGEGPRGLVASLRNSGRVRPRPQAKLPAMQRPVPDRLPRASRCRKDRSAHMPVRSRLRPGHARGASRAERASHGRPEDLDGLLADRRRGRDAPQGGGRPPSTASPTVTGGGPFEIAVTQGELPGTWISARTSASTASSAARASPTSRSRPRRSRGMVAERGLGLEYELGKKHDGAFDDAWVDELIELGRRWLGHRRAGAHRRGPRERPGGRALRREGQAAGRLRGAVRRCLRIPRHRLRGAHQGEWADSEMCRQVRLIAAPSCGHRRRCLRGCGRG